MKPRMMSKQAMDHLFDHILGGHQSSHEGIIRAKATGLLSDQELTELLKKNSDRLIDRIREFKALQRLTCIFFAVMFGYMQIGCEDLEMRRAKRVSTRRRQGSEIST